MSISPHNPSVWAIADLHLSFGTPNKGMEVFGNEWIDWTKKIEANWRSVIHPEDLVLIAGDISWAMHTSDVVRDLLWIDSLPGTKFMIRGNHDYWWESKSKVKKILPPSIQIIQNDALSWNNIGVGGARLWDTSEFKIVEQNQLPETSGEDIEAAEKIFVRELGRLEMSLQHLDPKADCRIVMTHYPPIGPNMLASRAAEILEKYRVDICVFGHLHGLNKNIPLFGTRNGIRYCLTACDYLDFKPLKIFEIKR